MLAAWLPANWDFRWSRAAVRRPSVAVNSYETPRYRFMPLREAAHVALL